jgi:ATP phosphoribosyltransferase regulatory subunit
VDDFCVCEVLSLAADSLAEISEEFVLDVSDLTLLGAVMDALQVSEAAKGEMLRCIGEKNMHGVKEIARREGADETALAKLCTLIGYDLPLAAGISALHAELSEYKELLAPLETLCRTLGVLAQKVHLDFSVVNDMSYYNGIVFKGFVNGVPAGVLSGGQYDGLMQKMGRAARAIGFAVYLDLLERYNTAACGYDADILLLYDESTDAVALTKAVKMLGDSGKTVRAQRRIPEGFRYRQLLTMKDRGLEILETND